MQERNVLYTGVPIHTVTSVTGKLTEDGRRLNSGNMLYRIRVTSVTDKYGTIASASGVLPLFTEDSQKRHWGSVISVPAQIIRDDRDRGWIAFKRSGTIKEVAPPDTLLLYRRNIQNILLERIERLPFESGSLFQALFLGLRDDLSEQEVALFRKSGAVHLLALSGMHLGIITGVISLILLPLIGKRGAFIFAVFVVICYVFVVGLKPSLLRAAVMFFLIGLGLLTGRRISGPVILIAAFIILALVYPGSLHTLSFKLSFLALAGILAVGKKISAKLVRFIPSPIVLPLAASFGAQLAVTPLTAAEFGAVYPVGIGSSLILAPLVTLFMVFGMVTLFLPGGMLLRVSALLMELINRVIFSIASASASVPHINLLTAEERSAAAAAALVVFSLFLFSGLFPGAVPLCLRRIFGDHRNSLVSRKVKSGL
jgi:competence protein ComEC